MVKGVSQAQICENFKEHFLQNNKADFQNLNTNLIVESEISKNSNLIKSKENFELLDKSNLINSQKQKNTKNLSNLKEQNDTFQQNLDEKNNEIFGALTIPSELKLDSQKPNSRNNRIYVLAVFPADHKANLSKLTQALNGTKASLTSEQECLELSDCVIGSIPPFSFHDKLLLTVDHKLFGRYEQIAFNAGLLDHSIVLNTDDYAKIAKPLVLDFADKIS
ncbi:MAG: hypothetical protein K5978_05640 [Campylobacter sp.]|nr:hypothetical protein [Campylobacter sp.]